MDFLAPASFLFKVCGKQGWVMSVLPASGLLLNKMGVLVRVVNRKRPEE
jgi:hypothetical protein